jgi:hypothetical protein
MTEIEIRILENAAKILSEIDGDTQEEIFEDIAVYADSLAMRLAGYITAIKDYQGRR